MPVPGTNSTTGSSCSSTSSISSTRKPIRLNIFTYRDWPANQSVASRIVTFIRLNRLRFALPWPACSDHHRARAEWERRRAASNKLRLGRDFRRPLARLVGVLRRTSGYVFDDHKMLRHGDALDQRRLFTRQCYFLSRKRRFLVNLFRNKRRRLDRLWKHAEFAGYLLERLLLVGPVQGGVVEAVHDGGFDDFEIGRDVEIARHVER